MAGRGSDSQKQLLSLIHNFAAEKSQGGVFVRDIIVIRIDLQGIMTMILLFLCLIIEIKWRRTKSSDSKKTNREAYIGAERVQCGASKREALQRTCGTGS